MLIHRALVYTRMRSCQWIKDISKSNSGCQRTNRSADQHMIIGLVGGSGVFVEVLPTFVLVSRIQFAQRYRDNTTSFSVASSSRLEAMVDGTLVRASDFCVRLGVSGTTIVSGSPTDHGVLLHHIPGFLAC